MFHRKKYPIQRQIEEADCGPVCLSMICNYYKKTDSIYAIKELFSLSKFGVSLLEIEEVARQLKFKTAAIKTTINYLSKAKPFPCILHWNQDHFVVLYRCRKNKRGVTNFLIADPAYGLVEISQDELEAHWLGNDEKGISLIIEPSEEFKDNRKSESKVTDRQPFVKFIKKHFSDNKTEIYKVLFFVAVSSLISWMFPILLRQLIDKGIMKKDINILKLIVLSQIGLLLGQIVSEQNRNKISIRITTKISTAIIGGFVNKLARLPINFFDSKTSADLIQRIEDHTRIESFLSNAIVGNLFQAITFLILSILLILYSSLLYGLYFILSLLSIIWITSFLKKRKALNYRQFRESYLFKSNLYEFITGMIEIKINVAQNYKEAALKETLAKLFKINKKTITLTQVQLLGVRILNIIKSTGLTILCSYWVASGKMSLGTMLGISYIIGFLNSATEAFVDFFRSSQDAIISVNRMNEIERRKDERSATAIKDFQTTEKSIRCENVSFSYPGPVSFFSLNDLSFEIPSGKVTALVGSSGSGKSTLLKLLLGFYHPNSGNIIIGDKSLKELDIDSWRKRCGVVLQNGYIFSSSISENITMRSDYIDKDRLAYSTKVACINDFIISLPKTYQTKIGESGLNLSGGQRQRILIARAVYNNPDFVFLDEATSSIDSSNEYNIMTNLENFFTDKTVLIIAHRLSTVKNANKIIVLNKGKIAEMGTHQELTGIKGHYYDLVKDQLALGI